MSQLTPIEQAIDLIEEPRYTGYENPNTFQDGVYAALDAIRALLSKPTPVSGEAVGELRCDASTGHAYGVYWYNHAPAIGTKVYTTPQPAIPEGYALVRIEITEKMHVAAVKAIQKCFGNDDFPKKVWKAMLTEAMKGQ